MKHIIITASDSKYGDFLINHWLKSLQDNVNLDNIDILILDYGLTLEQKKQLEQKNTINKNRRIKKTKQIRQSRILIKKCVRNGHVVTIRYRDVANFLSKHTYDQVLLIDSGDIIFQDDIKELFNEHKKDIRGLCEELTLADFNKLFITKCFEQKKAKEMKIILKNKKSINGGVIIGPSKKIIALSKEVYNIIKKKDIFGPDQTAVNYVLYRDGFKPLPIKYNMVINMSKVKFVIKNGIFYFKNKLDDTEKIPIVHNAGGYSFFRPIKKFGHGPTHNKSAKLIHHVLKLLAKTKTKFSKNN